MGFQRSGGSTITQQLAKNLYFDYEPSITRKIAEVFVAHDLERMYSKEQLFSYYVNIINYGDGYFGISAAADGYFHVTSELSNHFDRALKRQKQVLQAMVDQEMISLKEMNQILLGE